MSFDEHRRHLFAIAYRMLGSASDADDMVQDAYLRWRQRPDEVREPRAYLSRVIARLCIDRLRSLRSRRESYVGTWLPEPVLEDPTDPLARVSISPAFLLLMERLGPVERAAFLLRDVFDFDYADIAEVVDRTPEACRQLVSRARKRVAVDQRRHPVDREHQQALTARFLAAAQTGDLDALVELLAEDARVLSDGGGVASAARNVITGRARIARFLIGTAQRFTGGLTIRPAVINGLPGLVMIKPDGSPHGTVAVELDGDGVLAHAVYIVRNPDKLGRIG